MKVLKGVAAVLPQSLSRPVIAIGNFDGVHLGHVKMIQVAREKANERGGQCVIYTFRPHPQLALRPDRGLPLILSYDEKLELLAQLGIDCVIEEPFTFEFSRIEAEQFFGEILLRRMGAEVVVVGYDFAFGKERQGRLEVLAAFCQKAGIELVVVAPQSLDGDVISSSRIRRDLSIGEVQKANRLLGRCFFYRGVVSKGEQRGRLLGFPTANIKMDGTPLLPYGVYSTWTCVGGKKIPSVTNLGVRPTFNHVPSCAGLVFMETHLIDTSLELYGELLEIQFVCRLRGEQKFSNADALRMQITQDIQSAKKALHIT